MSVSWQTNINPTPPGSLPKGTSNGEYGKWFSGLPSASPMLSRPLRRSSSVRVSGSGTGSNVYQGAFAPKPPPRPLVGTLDRQYYPQYVTKISMTDGDVKQKSSAPAPSSDTPSQNLTTQLPVTRRPMETPMNSPTTDKQVFVNSNKPLEPIASEFPITRDSSTNTQISPRYANTPFSNSSLRRNHTMTEFDARRRMAEFENQRKMTRNGSGPSAMTRTATFSEYDRNRKDNGIDHFDGSRYRTLPDTTSNWNQKETSDDILHRAARTKLSLGPRTSPSNGTLNGKMGHGKDQVEVHLSPSVNSTLPHSVQHWQNGSLSRQNPGSIQNENSFGSTQNLLDTTGMTSRSRHSYHSTAPSSENEEYSPSGTSDSPAASSSAGPFPVSPSNVNNYKQMMSAGASSSLPHPHNQNTHSSAPNQYNINHLANAFRPNQQTSHMTSSNLSLNQQPINNRNFGNNILQNNQQISNQPTSNLEKDYRQVNSIASKLLAPSFQKYHNVQVHIHNNNVQDQLSSLNHVETPPSHPQPMIPSNKKTKSILKKKSSYENNNYKFENVHVMNGSLKMGTFESRTLPHLRHHAAALGNFGFLSDPHTVATVTIPDRKRAPSSGKRVTFAF